LQRRVQAEITHFRAGDRVDRDTLHDRTLARLEERDATPRTDAASAGQGSAQSRGPS
jgi:hypothetical protein